MLALWYDQVSLEPCAKNLHSSKRWHIFQLAALVRRLFGMSRAVFSKMENFDLSTTPVDTAQRWSYEIQWRIALINELFLCLNDSASIVKNLSFRDMTKVLCAFGESVARRWCVCVFCLLTPSALLLNAKVYVTVYESPGLISPTILSSTRTSPSVVAFQIRFVLAVPSELKLRLVLPFWTYFQTISKTQTYSPKTLPEHCTPFSVWCHMHRNSYNSQLLYRSESHWLAHNFHWPVPISITGDCLVEI